MRTKRFNLWSSEEYNYPMAFGFRPNLVSYQHEAQEIRPCMIVVPGGGYATVSPTEAEIVAMEFYERGYNTFVLTYTTNLLGIEPLKDQPMKDLSRAIRLIRKAAADFCVNSEQLVLCGFSAGGHLCGSVCVHYQDIAEERDIFAAYSNRPNAAILSYPVITAGEYANRGSFQNLLGSEAEKEALDYMSLEKHVKPDTPPCFLWQTVEDEAVPVMNSYLYADACRSHQVPFAHHVFMKGQHGLSLANEKWARGEYGNPYTMEQTMKLIEKVKTGEISVSKEAKDMLLLHFDLSEEDGKDILAQYQVNEEVSIWPQLAECWLRPILKS